MSDNNRSDEVDETEEDEEDEIPNYQTTLLARIRQMKAEGVEFLSASDLPDSTGTPSQGFTTFHSRSSFGR